MLEEQKQALHQILMYVKQYKPEVVLIAGDIYDRSVPGTEAVCLFHTFLEQLHETGTKICFISGNHDSGERLHFAGGILKESGVYPVGIYEGNIKYVQLQDDYGDVYIWLLPFLNPAKVSIYHKEGYSYTEALQAVLQAEGFLKEDTQAYPEWLQKGRHILLAHQFVTDKGKAEVCDSEFHTVGGIDEVDVSLFRDFDYVALGHLHGEQWIGRETVRYAGSPIKYSASEVEQKKSVTLVELKEKGNIAIQLLPLTPIHDMRVIKGPLKALISEEVVKAGDARDYMHVILTDEKELYDALGQLRVVYPNLMSLKIVHREEPSLSMQSIYSTKETPIVELFTQFYEMQNGVSLQIEEMDLLKKYLEELA